MATQPKKYVEMRAFFRWWAFHYKGAEIDTVAKFVESLSCEGERLGPDLGPWSDYPTAFRRLRQDARVRVVSRFFNEAAPSVRRLPG